MYMYMYMYIYMYTSDNTKIIEKVMVSITTVAQRISIPSVFSKIYIPLWNM